MSGDEGGCGRRCEVHYGAGEFVGITEPTHGSVVDDLFSAGSEASVWVVQSAAILFGRKKAGTDAVHSDTTGRPLACEELGEVNHGCFGG